MIDFHRRLPCPILSPTCLAARFPDGGPLYQDLIHFNSPYFVLRPGERPTTGVYTVYVTGYLLTNRSFLPDVERN